MVQLSPSLGSARAARGRWIPWVFVAGMMTVVCVNAVLVFFAVQSWAGIVTARPYERGLAYNQLIAAAAQDSALGWWANAAYQPANDAGPGILSVELRDARGMPLNGADLSVELLRPLEPAQPMIVALFSAGAGRYVGPLEHGLRRGQWETRIKVTRDGVVAHFNQRIAVR
jgi:nitrogen fixation protein FixH